MHYLTFLNLNLLLGKMYVLTDTSLFILRIKCETYAKVTFLPAAKL